MFKNGRRKDLKTRFLMGNILIRDHNTRPIEIKEQGGRVSSRS
jgi:hypothetical protein